MAQIHEASQTMPCNMGSFGGGGSLRESSRSAARGGGGAQKGAASRASGGLDPDGHEWAAPPPRRVTSCRWQELGGRSEMWMGASQT